eukprot:402611-Pelagomonas_calceolata.AAC.6
MHTVPLSANHHTHFKVSRKQKYTDCHHSRIDANVGANLLHTKSILGSTKGANQLWQVDLQAAAAAAAAAAAIPVCF